MQNRRASSEKGGYRRVKEISFGKGEHLEKVNGGCFSLGRRETGAAKKHQIRTTVERKKRDVKKPIRKELPCALNKTKLRANKENTFSSSRGRVRASRGQEGGKKPMSLCPDRSPVKGERCAKKGSQVSPNGGYSGKT